MLTVLRPVKAAARAIIFPPPSEARVAALPEWLHRAASGRAARAANAPSGAVRLIGRVDAAALAGARLRHTAQRTLSPRSGVRKRPRARDTDLLNSAWFARATPSPKERKPTVKEDWLEQVDVLHMAL